MNVNVMRRIVAEQYNSDKWKRKVQKMSDERVTAIYLKMKERDQI